MKKRFQKGFTLIELLVVIAIIGMLASIILASLNSARVKARDARRLSDMKEIQTALELYDNENNAYPILSTQNTDQAGFAAGLGVISTSGFMPSIPADPTNNSSHYYIYVTNSDGSFYCLGAVMEGNPPASSCNTARLGVTPSVANYLVGP